MYYQKLAKRTLERADITAEFYSFPQKYVLGMDSDAEPLETWKATVSSMIQISASSDGDKPTVGQFTTPSMSPFTEQLRTAAALFAGETGLTLDDLGFISDNPSSVEAIKASHENLRLSGKAAHRSIGSGLRNWWTREDSKLEAIDYDQIAALYLANTEIIIESLEDLKGVYRSSLISFLQESRLRETAIITSGAFVERVINRVKPNNIDEMLRGYYLERKIIFEYEAQHLITAKQARRMRQNVNELESYSLIHEHRKLISWEKGRCRHTVFVCCLWCNRPRSNISRH